MSLDLPILRDLKAGQSTASSIAGRLGRTEAEIVARLGLMYVERFVDSKPLSVLTVWFLTEAGLQHVI